jgi:predicted RNase H-like HicB family nuclease
MKEKNEYNYIIERDSEGWYVGSVPELRGCHTQAKSLDELAVRMKEVIALCLEDEEDSNQLEFVGIQKVAV